MGDMIIRNGDVIVVADGEKALFLVNRGDTVNPDLRVMREMEQENPPTRDQGEGRPGRLNDASFGHKSAVEETDWHRVAKERFAREIADRMHALVQAGKIDRLIVAAAPRVLGEMRKAMHRDVESRVIAEIDKDLTKHPVDKIGKLLA